MADGQSEETVYVRRRPSWGRIASYAALGLIILLIAGIAIVWIERRPIATEFLKREFERRGVTASYHLDRVGLRTQQVSNLVIGDPKRPDLVARYAQIQMRLKWNGSSCPVCAATSFTFRSVPISNCCARWRRRLPM